MSTNALSRLVEKISALGGKSGPAMNNPGPSVGVGCIVKHPDGRVLLVRRKGSYGGGTWSTPGGYLEYGETLEDCAAREVKEETGIVVRDVRFHAVTNDLFPEANRHFVTIWMFGALGGGEFVPSEEIDQVAWFERDALPSPLFLSLENLLKSNGLP